MNEIKYTTNKDNKEYISISINDLCLIIFELQDLKEEELFNEANNILSAMQMHNYKKDTIINDINITKSSEIGQFIINNRNLTTDLSNYITNDKIINAMNIAIYEDNPKITNKLIRLFKGRYEGSREELEEITKKEVIDYILENDNLKEYLQKENGIYEEKKYYVYEDKKIKLKPLTNTNKVKVKSIQNT